LYAIVKLMETGGRIDCERQKQAGWLADFFLPLQVDRIISSPYVRAVESIRPTAVQKGLAIERDARLQERIFSAHSREDWFDCLRETFTDLDLCFEGGESSRMAMNRAYEAVDEWMMKADGTLLFVTHGNLLALLLKKFVPRFGFSEWRRMSNPDVYVVERGQEGTSYAASGIRPIWNKILSLRLICYACAFLLLPSGRLVKRIMLKIIKQSPK
jgi:2,3-bisphosphoglycerate-dependent phosphoglycerate mutase